jgi:hypothetical protein
MNSIEYRHKRLDIVKGYKEKAITNSEHIGSMLHIQDIKQIIELLKDIKRRENRINKVYREILDSDDRYIKNEAEDLEVISHEMMTINM